MNYIHKIFDVLFILLALVVMNSCANIQAPIGGPDDTDPPELVSVFPARSTLNFDTKQKITFTFNERIDASTLYQNLLISPYTEADYKFEVNNKKLIFQFKDQLDSNTTYTLNFGKGLTDITDKNPAENLYYAFSTGNYIDSLIVSGTVENYLTKERVEKATVALYKLTDTLDLAEDKPTYYSQTDKEGNFLLQNIKEDKYLLLAFKDTDINNSYSKYREEFAVYADTILLTENLNSIKLVMRDAELEPLKIISKTEYKDISIISFNNSLKEYDAIDSVTSESLQTYFDEIENELHIFHSITDSSKIILNVIDTIINELDTVLQVYTSESKFAYPEFKISLKPKKTIKYTKENISIELHTSYPIKDYNANLFYFFTDTVNVDTLNKNNLNINSKRTVLKVDYQTPFHDTLYFSLDSSAIVSYSGDSITPKRKMYTAYNAKEYGTLSGKIESAYTSYEFQLLLGTEIITTLDSPKEYIIEDLKPGIYNIRCLIDKNESGFYDLGEIEKLTSPEPVYNYKNDLKVKANWEIAVPTLVF